MFGTRPMLTITTSASTRSSDSGPCGHHHARAPGLEAQRAVAEVEVDPQLLEPLRERPRHLGVERRGELGQELDDRHLGAELGVDAAELEADVAAADHHQALGNGLQRQRLARADDGLPVVREARAASIGREPVAMIAGSNWISTCPPSVATDSERSLGELGAAVHHLDAVLVAQDLDPAGEAPDDPVLPLHHRRQVDREALDGDPQGRTASAHLLGEVGGVDQRLRRDAAVVEADSAEALVLLDEDHVLAELGQPDGGHVAARAGADHDHLAAAGHRSDDHHNLTISRLGSETSRDQVAS